METTYTVTITFSNEGSHTRSFRSLFAAVVYAEELRDTPDVTKIVIRELATFYTNYSETDTLEDKVLSLWTRTEDGWKYGFG